MEKYYERLMGELERRESQFTSVVDRGESLIIAHHPASKVLFDIQLLYKLCV